jgi:hypothetical protein
LFFFRAAFPPKAMTAGLRAKRLSVINFVLLTIFITWKTIFRLVRVVEFLFMTVQIVFWALLSDYDLSERKE